MSSRVFTMLENNPEVMNDLGSRLGLSKKLSFYDVYSLDDPDLLAMVPRPVFALLAIIPRTDSWAKVREAEDSQHDWYDGSGPEEPILWFRQTITNGCGLVGFLHCTMNGPPAEMLVPGSDLAKFAESALPLKMDDRAQLLHDSDVIFNASQASAQKGDTSTNSVEHIGQHFVAFVKGKDGHLWELEGSRKRPLDRGALADDEDALSERALNLSLKNLIDMQRAQSDDLRFSCIALAARPTP